MPETRLSCTVSDDTAKLLKAAILFDSNYNSVAHFLRVAIKHYLDGRPATLILREPKAQPTRTEETS